MQRGAAGRLSLSTPRWGGARLSPVLASVHWRDRAVVTAARQGTALGGAHHAENISGASSRESLPKPCAANLRIGVSRVPAWCSPRGQDECPSLREMLQRRSSPFGTWCHGSSSACRRARSTRRSEFDHAIASGRIAPAHEPPAHRGGEHLEGSGRSLRCVGQPQLARRFRPRYSCDGVRACELGGEVCLSRHSMPKSSDRG